MKTDNCTRRNFIKGLGAGIAAMALRQVQCFADKPKRQPNIVFFLTADLGWRDTCLYGIFRQSRL